MRNFMITSEAVTEGHPDKLRDQISGCPGYRPTPRGRWRCGLKNAAPLG